MWTKFVKVIAYIALAGGAIASLVLGVIVSKGLDSTLASFGIFLGGTLATAILVGMIMVIVEISESAQNCESYLYNTSLSQSPASSDASVSNGKSNLLAVAARERENEIKQNREIKPSMWKCKCGQSNIMQKFYCQSCGKGRDE